MELSTTKLLRQEMRLQSEWVNSALLGVKMSGTACPQLNALRQGYDVCRQCRGLTADKMCIGGKTYKRGIATHSVSEIVVTLPSPGRTFLAEIGRDENGVTRGLESDIVFSVEVNGREEFRSGSFKGGEPVQRIAVPLHGAIRFTIRVDGVVHLGHADWADAAVELKNGEKIWLDELPFSCSFPQLSGQTPFSFVYSGVNSTELLPKWDVRRQTVKIDLNRTQHIISYRDPATGLEAKCSAIAYEDFPAVEWVLEFHNSGDADTPILERIQALDMDFTCPSAEPAPTLYHALGSNDSAMDFATFSHELKWGSTFNLAPLGGRGSSETLPFFNLEGSGGGIIAAIGWTGQWAASFQRRDDCLNITAGMELTHLKLHPGERIRTPKIMLLFWQGDRGRAHNRFRQLVLKHYTPRPGGKLLQTPISYGSWGALPEQTQLSRIKALLKNKVPFDCFWIDAGWFGETKAKGDWAGQAGNWFFNTDYYPHGMKPISDALHKAGKKLILWFDPERVCAGTVIHKEHPEWLLKEADPVEGQTHDPNRWGMLFNLGNPDARNWITSLISGFIEKEGIDIYRQDFNIDPLGFWRKADAPDRQGITEIRYIEGLYTFWDELLLRHPNLVIDNCASGGRRIDLETISRSVPLWRSDLQCSPNYSTYGSQSQTFALSSWVPLHATGCRENADTYDFRSALSSGIVMNHALEVKDFPWAWLRNMAQEAFALRKFFYGDFHPLTPNIFQEDVWLAYQLDRPDLGEGAVFVYRRADSPYTDAFFKLQGLKGNKEYSLALLGTKRKWKATGEELMKNGQCVCISKPRDSLIILYRLEARGQQCGGSPTGRTQGEPAKPAGARHA